MASVLRHCNINNISKKKVAIQPKQVSFWKEKLEKNVINV